MKKLFLAVLLAGSAVATAAYGQAFPTKPVTMVVPFTAGGPTDTVARSLGAAMGKPLGQTVIVENVGGAGGTIGAARVKNATPDGHTVLLHHIGMSTAPALYRKLAYNPLTDFEMIGLVVDVPMTIIARSDFPAGNLAEAIGYIRKNKDRINLANAGLGAASHLCGLLFMSAIETDLTTIPFKGTADAMNALLGKQVDVLCDQTTNTTGQIKAGTVKSYAVTSATRSAALPALPTAAEAGLAGFEVGVWHGIYAPKGTPKAVIERLNAALLAGARDPDFGRRMTELGASIYSAANMTPEAHAALLKAQIEKWGPIIRKAGAYAD
jgi:tripartite-type tricarboxylate transporter receptor subunit TctC